MTLAPGEFVTDPYYARFSTGSKKNKPILTQEGEDDTPVLSTAEFIGIKPLISGVTGVFSEMPKVVLPPSGCQTSCEAACQFPAETSTETTSEINNIMNVVPATQPLVGNAFPGDNPPEMPKLPDLVSTPELTPEAEGTIRQHSLEEVLQKHGLAETDVLETDDGFYKIMIGGVETFCSRYDLEFTTTNRAGVKRHLTAVLKKVS